MLTQINLDNFKCFDSLSLRLSPLTLLTGFNAAGKSTTLQSLLLLAQALRSGNRLAELPLNGPLARLGTPGEVLKSGSGEVSFSIGDGRTFIKWTLQAENRTQGIAMRIPHIAIESKTGTKDFNDLENLERLLPPGTSGEPVELVESLGETIFLSAVRMGTADVFPSPEESLPVYADVGVQGEFAPWWFHQFFDEEIEQARCNQSDEARTLRRQFNAWASELFPGAQANVQTIDKTNLLRLELRIGDVGDWRRPSNIGYGLTYAFPIIVAGLLAKPGQMLIIDSPEAHLHPSGQSQMGCFLATVAAAGVQVIIETHSDHILNGIRRAIGEHKILTSEQAAVYFFDGKVDSPTKLEFAETGSIRSWPSGFFDQYQLDVTALTKVRRLR
ncbi:DUF3696 domain-containing protein [uncultured Desulfuromusa sp.]|uniref:AAA family ATPase n=1 Tax=uncultured Desulfuromusa sp. TaxID=219183 RepID=UPI002AA7EA48|nr:DUF3696 domain-containing protein [uncultured Desulfuromusa sp.]